MRVKSLKINNLRNLPSFEIDPHPRFNVLYGHNGAGKTSVLEALILLAKGRSFRGGGMDALIGPEAEHLRCFARIVSDQDTEHRMGLERSRDSWQARLDGETVQRFSELAQRLPFVLIEPNSHLLVSGSPDVRRRFLDWGVFHVKHSHLDRWRRYSRAIKQRNAALKARNLRVAQTLEPQLAALGTELDQYRQAEAKRLSSTLPALLKQLSPSLPPVTLAYRRGWRDLPLSDALNDARQGDLERGQTYPGPHRADLQIQLQPGAARDRLSRGEQKIVAAALQLAQATGLLDRNIRPLLLLDDLASEFDEQHLATVVDAARALKCQVWITGTQKGDYAPWSSSGGTMFHVKQGHCDAVEPC